LNSELLDSATGPWTKTGNVLTVGTFTPTESTATETVFFYYVQITNTKEGGADPKTTNSNVVSVTIVAANQAFVTFDVNGGSPTIPSQAVTKGAALGTVTTVTKSGYIFDGWWDYSGVNVAEYTATSTINDNITLKAKWVTPREEWKDYQVPLTGVVVANATALDCSTSE